MQRRQWLTLCVATLLLALFGAGVLLLRAAPGPAIATVTVGDNPDCLGGCMAVDATAGRAFVSNANGIVSVIDTASGRLVHTIDVGKGGNSQPYEIAVDPRVGHAFVSGSSGNFVSVIDTRRAVLLGSLLMNAPTALSLNTMTGRVFVSSYADNQVYMLDTRTTRVLHTSDVSGSKDSVVDERWGHVFVGTPSDGLHMLDAHSGVALRTIPLNPKPGIYPNTLALDEHLGRLFVTDRETYTVFIVDTRSGSIIKTVHVGPSGTNSTFLGVVADARTGHVFVGDETTKTVWMLDARRGVVLRTVLLHHPVEFLAVVNRTGEILVSTLGQTDRSGQPTGDGAVWVLDGHSGAVRRTIPVGVAPVDIVVDENRQRALVLDTNADPGTNATPMQTRPREGVASQVLRRIKQTLPWLPFQAPKPPALTTHGSVTTLDLTGM